MEVFLLLAHWVAATTVAREARVQEASADNPAQVAPVLAEEGALAEPPA